MATPADAKAAPLPDELKEFALTLDPKGFPKNFFCALCGQLAFDSYKLLCCNKAICSSCHVNPDFPTTCPSCDHSPLEAGSSTVNKALRGTIRAWLQKLKKREEAKAAVQAVTPAAEAVNATSEALPATDATEPPAEGTEEVPLVEDTSAGQIALDQPGGELQRVNSEGPQPHEDPTLLQEPENQYHEGRAPQAQNQSPEPQDPSNIHNMNGPGNAMFNNTAIMGPNGVPNQFAFGLNPNQGNMNGMVFNNGMNPMNGMPNMMGNGSWNMNTMNYGMNPMNGMSGMHNGMFGGFGGNQGMGMNDMSVMMNFGNGYNGAWNGMGGGGYGNFNGYIGGNNQSATYPDMNRLQKNNFPIQNRFNTRGGTFQQRNHRNGSFGTIGPNAGFQNNTHSRPGSRNGPYHRDGESPAGTANAAVETNLEDEQAKASAEALPEGKDNTMTAPDHGSEPTYAEHATSNEVPEVPTQSTEAAAMNSSNMSNLNQIQTVDSVEEDPQNYDQSIMENSMQYPQQMGGQYNHNMGFPQNNYGHRSGFNNAYGAATVLTGEPRGLGVAGAPTGPRAMREGRPNTGYQSRLSNARFNAPVPVVAPSQEVPPASPPHRARSRSLGRDETLRTADRSLSRSRSKSQGVNEDYRDRSRSVDRNEPREDRDQSRSPGGRDGSDHNRHEERRPRRSSRYDDSNDRDERDDYDDRYREDKDSRGDRTRSASTDSKYRSRRSKEKHRTSRSHRDRSREYRRRHRSRSHSPLAEEKYESEDVYANGTEESSSRRKSKSDKHRERERDRSRDRDRERDRRDRKDRDYERDYDGKYRSRDKDKERRRRRDREEDDDREYDDDKHRSSRRSRKDRDRDRDRERDYEEPKSATSTRAVSPPLNAPTGPSADNFSIRGASKPKNMLPPQLPTGPRGFQPPKGPSANRHKHERKGSNSSVVSSSTPAAPQDHYAAERERNARERDRLDRDTREPAAMSLNSRTASHYPSSRPSLSSKRSRDEFEYPQDDAKGSSRAASGPSSHRDKRKRSGTGDDGASDLAFQLAQGLRKKSGARRRGGVKNEGDVERELERTERERDGRRW